MGVEEGTQWSVEVTGAHELGVHLASDPPDVVDDVLYTTIVGIIKICKVPVPVGLWGGWVAQIWGRQTRITIGERICTVDELLASACNAFDLIECLHHMLMQASPITYRAQLTWALGEYCGAKTKFRLVRREKNRLSACHTTLLH